MKQISLEQTGFEVVRLKSRKRIFLEEMNQTVPWRDLVALIERHRASSTGPQGGRPPFASEVMLRIHFLQQWFGLSDLAMQEALHDVPLYREFTGLDGGQTRLPDESTILRFRHLLEQKRLAEQIFACVNTILLGKGLMLKAGSAIDATIIAAPSSTKNKDGKRDSEMHQTQKGKQWHFGMKAHIGVDAASGLVHSVVGTAANAHDVTQANALVREADKEVFADAGYQGAHKREESKNSKLQWQVAMRPGKRKTLDKQSPWGKQLNQMENFKASVRAKVEHPFQVIKCQWGYTKVRYKGLFKNTQQLITLFALVNLKMVRKRIA